MCSMGPDKKRVKKKTRKRRLDKASEMEGQRPRKLYAKPNRTQLACFHCWKSKTKCDENRPCRRCSKKGIVACFDRPPNPQAFRAELKRRQEMNKMKRSQHHHPTAKPISMTPLLASPSVSYAQSSCPNGLLSSRVSQPTSQCNQRMNMPTQTNSYPICGEGVPAPAMCGCDLPSANFNSAECAHDVSRPIGRFGSPNLSFAGSIATREHAATTSLPLSFPPPLNLFQSSSYDWMSHGVPQTSSQPGVTLKEETESILAALPPAVAVDAEQVVSSYSSQLCSNSFTQPDTYPWQTYYHQQFNDVQAKMEPRMTETQRSLHVQQKFMFSSSVGNGGSPSELNPHFSSYSSQPCGPFCNNGGGCSSSCPFQFPQPSCYTDPQFARMTNSVSAPGSFDQYPVTPLASSQQSYNMIPPQFQTPSQQPFGSMHSEIQRFPMFSGDEGNGVSAVRV